MGQLQELDSILQLQVWKDGKLVEPAEAVVSVWDHGFLYGDGVFEGIRLRDRRIYRVEDHLQRLRRSSHLIGLELAFTNDAIIQGIAQTANANGLDDAHVRVIHTRGVGLPGVDPRRCPKASVLIMAYPFPPLLGTEPITLMVSSVARKSPRSVDPAAKSLNYLDSVLAKMQANAAGAHDAIMLDGEGYVAEATAANVFCVHDGVLRTPPTTAALPGITRRTVLELAEVEGIRTETGRLTPGDLYVADEAFLTGTGAGIVPIARVDGRVLKSAPGPITGALSDAYARTWSDDRYSMPVGP
jgi:branched-chain amino acid aminotransferase